VHWTDGSEIITVTASHHNSNRLSWWKIIFFCLSRHVHFWISISNCVVNVRSRTTISVERCISLVHCFAYFKLYICSFTSFYNYRQYFSMRLLRLFEYLRRAFNLTVKSNDSNAKYSLFFNTVTTEFNAFVALFCQTVYAIKRNLIT